MTGVTSARVVSLSTWSPQHQSANQIGACLGVSVEFCFAKNSYEFCKLRPFIMVIVEIENGLYDIMNRPALESVEKEAKLL